MGRLRDLRERHRTGWGVAAGVLAAVGLTVAAFAFALGTCHDAGGFCAEPFGAVHVELYATAAVLAAASAATAATIATLRRLPVVVAGCVGAAAVVVLAVVGESVGA